MPPSAMGSTETPALPYVRMDASATLISLGIPDRRWQAPARRPRRGRAQNPRGGEQRSASSQRCERGGAVGDARRHPVSGGERRGQQRGGGGFVGPAGSPGREPGRIGGAGERRQCGQGSVWIGEESGLAAEVAEEPGEGERAHDVPLGQQPGGRIHILPVMPGGVGQLGGADQVGGAQCEVARVHPAAEGVALP
jgi:hypothetical protein